MHVKGSVAECVAVLYLSAKGEVMADEYHVCGRGEITWDDEPDHCGTMGRSMYWLGECECGRKVYARYEYKGVFNASTDEEI